MDDTGLPWHRLLLGSAQSLEQPFLSRIDRLTRRRALAVSNALHAWLNAIASVLSPSIPSRAHSCVCWAASLSAAGRDEGCGDDPDVQVIHCHVKTVRSRAAARIGPIQLPASRVAVDYPNMMGALELCSSALPL